MGAKHTPGRNRNWTALTGSSGYGAHGGVRVTDNRGLVVAVAIGDVPELDALATARLIASAPDLLEAAKSGFLAVVGVKMAMAVESNGWQWPDDAPDTVPIPAENLRAAIRKATGEAS